MVPRVRQAFAFSPLMAARACLRDSLQYSAEPFGSRCIYRPDSWPVWRFKSQQKPQPQPEYNLPTGPEKSIYLFSSCLSDLLINYSLVKKIHLKLSLSLTPLAY
jgi:hypothetical protein